MNLDPKVSWWLNFLLFAMQSAAGIAWSQYLDAKTAAMLFLALGYFSNLLSFAVHGTVPGITSQVTSAGKTILAFLVILLALTVFGSNASAADLPAKKALFGPYPTTKCGIYYGVGTGGSATAMNGSVVGAQIVQGELDALVGYTCPFATNAFWFVEGSVGFDNINGSVNGLALSGPLVLIQRAGAGSPINAWFNPFGNQLALPSLPALPSGVTAGPANGYFFAGLVEQDISVQVGLEQHNKVWLVAPLVGVGLLSRFSDGVVVDTWAAMQLNSQSFCAGGTCGKMGNGGRVGVSFKY